MENCSNCLIFNANTTWNIDLSDSHFVTVSNCYIGYTLGLGVKNRVAHSTIETLNLSNSSHFTENNITEVLVTRGCHNNTLFNNNLLGQNNFIVSSKRTFGITAHWEIIGVITQVLVHILLIATMLTTIH